MPSNAPNRLIPITLAVLAAVALLVSIYLMMDRAILAFMSAG
jgi:hypothetical protein